MVDTDPFPVSEYRNGHLQADGQGTGSFHRKIPNDPARRWCYSTSATATQEKARADFPGVPLFLFGHSLGGLIALNYVLKKQPDLTGVIISAPLLQLAYKPATWRILLLKTLKALNLNLSIQRETTDTKLSRDINVARTFRNDPLSHRNITPSLAVGMFEAGDWCLANADRLALPTLLYHGSADEVTSPAASRKFAERAGNICTFKILPDYMHEPHNEPSRQEVFELVQNWLKENL